MIEKGGLLTTDIKGDRMPGIPPSYLSSQVTKNMALIPKNYARLESGYREKALKIYPWVCGRCAREFVYSNL